MLISCPKCHSIYEIPDDLIGRTGKNFRCQACSNVWHALPEDAIGYMAKTADNTPYIEAIPVTEPPHRHFPANQENYQIPLDTKSGQRTRSSKELIAAEGGQAEVKFKKRKKEITLTSEQGTSFTISALPDTDEIEDKTPHLYTQEDSFHATQEDRLQPEKSFRGYKKATAFLLLAFLFMLSVFLRRDIVALYPDAEEWYNKVFLSGLNNPEQLKFTNIQTIKQVEGDQLMLKLKAVIDNPSRFGTHVPAVVISGQNQTYQAKSSFLKSKQTTEVEITLPLPKEDSVHFTLGFKRP